MKHFILFVAIAVFSFVAMPVKAQEIGLSVGDKAPEIIETNLDGEKISLSSLKGKVVLIDFWASWCGPCRRENPAVVQNYNEFKDAKFKNGKGFTVYSVSLDQKKAAWKKGIAEDQLVWPYHVSDLKGWYGKAAKQYKVRRIPANFLIGGDGIIIAKNLRGRALQTILQGLLK